MYWFQKLFRKNKETNPATDELPHEMQFSRRELFYDEVQEQWQSLQYRLGEEATTDTGRVVPMYAQWGKIAAAVAGFILAVGLGWWVYQNQSYAHYQTAFGQTQRIVLPDQSVVMLNANSSLRYRKDWTPGQLREVWLEGEGFFQVRKQPDKAKFWVHSEELRVEVLGTEFNVNSRRGKTQVVLQSGKVRLTPDDQAAAFKTVYMKPNELVDFVEQEKQFRKRVVKASRYLAWQQQKMIFDDIPLSEAVLMLEDFYGVKVKIESSELASRKLTGEISTRNPDVCFQAIASLLETEVTQQDNQVIFGQAPQE